MSFDLPALTAAVAAHGRVARIVITATAGSVPRGAGTSMLVWKDGQSGTIGGGALEHMATQRARRVLNGSESWQETVPLGPAVGQCCGGSVTLAGEVFSAHNMPDQMPYIRAVQHGEISKSLSRRLAHLPDHFAPIAEQGWLVEGPLRETRNVWIYGAGHVGRALVGAMAPLPDMAITWVDTGAERFPLAIPDNVAPFVAAHTTQAVPHAPDGADHLILTYSHAFDLALCDAVLRRPFGSLGLIGSATKWARFQRRLAAMGHSRENIARIVCPIGDPHLGKHPAQIALGVAAAWLGRAQSEHQKGKTG